MSEPKAVLVSDLHLGVKQRPRTIAALERLSREYPNAEWIFNGDVFEFSMFPASRNPEAVLGEMLDFETGFVSVVQERLVRGRNVTFIAGNHDAVLTRLERLLRARLGDEHGRLRVARWFVRREGVHIEHGHIYDPDNAPLHPLADFSFETEPLGTALMRRFVAAAGALEFAHAHDTTPAAGIARAFQLYGVRAPWMIAQYFACAGTLCWEAEVGRAEQIVAAREQGEDRLRELVDAESIGADDISRLLQEVPTPTHTSGRLLFHRLYFDRILALALGVGGALGTLLGGRWLSMGVTGGATGYLLRHRKKYGKRPEVSLRASAHAIASLPNIRGVVFGHTHVSETSGSYLNLGSFTYHRGHAPYAVLFEGGHVELRKLE